MEKENVAVYGLSDKTLSFINNNYKYNIVCLLDGKLKSGIKYGINICSLEDLVKLKIKKVIIVASESATIIIYNRIKDFCKKMNIAIYKLISKEDDKIQIIKIEDVDRKKRRNKDIKDAETIGYFILGPIINAFIIWLRSEISKKEYKEIWFLSRDGYLLKKIFDLYDNKIVSRYFEFSRTAGLVISNSSFKNIREASLLPYEANIEEILKKRFLLDENKIFKDKDKIKESNLESYLKENENLIINNANIQKKYFYRYIKNNNIQIDNIALVDFVSTGTCQMYLENILNISIDGYYFVRLFDKNINKNLLNIKSLLDKNSNLCKLYLYLEDLLKEAGPSVWKYNDSGMPNYFKESRSSEHLKFINSIQNSILKYCYDNKDNPVNLVEADGILEDFFSSSIHIKEIANENITDEFTARKYSMKGILY